MEKDNRFFPALQMLSQAVEHNRFHLVQGDILQIKEQELLETFHVKPASSWQDQDCNIAFVGNLPFGIATPLIIKWLREMSTHSGAFAWGRIELLLMFQREVAERMAAKPNEKTFGRLAVACQNYCHVRYTYTVKGSSFVPPPKVDAGVVHMVPRVEPLVPMDMEHLEAFCRTLFHSRRKRWVSNLLYVEFDI